MATDTNSFKTLLDVYWENRRFSILYSPAVKKGEAKNAQVTDFGI